FCYRQHFMQMHAPNLRLARPSIHAASERYRIEPVEIDCVVARLKFRPDDPGLLSHGTYPRAQPFGCGVQGNLRNSSACRQQANSRATAAKVGIADERTRKRVGSERGTNAVADHENFINRVGLCGANETLRKPLDALFDVGAAVHVIACES